ncbi:MAG: radical SAM protein [Deltaproteobacteria bacterium]|nr:radical SAM protein [Deltaproteobacteria bacterium]
MTKQLQFEQGPIRPPNESRSLLLRFTRNCPWNQCRFCPVYKGRKFSLRSTDEIKQDIRTAREMADEIKALSWQMGYQGKMVQPVISRILQGANYSESFKSLAVWLHYGTWACFLQDADNLIMKTRDLVEVLDFLKKSFPEMKRVTTYSRSRTIVRKSVESLKAIREAGLDRIHVGLETGYDPLLKFMKKGVTSAQHIDAGQKVLQAGMELSEYVMPGLGGQAMWREHAVETANVLNQINPHFIRIRSLRIPDRIPLAQDRRDGSFLMQTDDMVAEELRVFIENLDGITSVITSDHIMNLLEELSGRFPKDKEKMLTVIKKYQKLSDYERIIYRIGRRGGVYHSTDDLDKDVMTRQKIEKLIQNIIAEKGTEGLDPFISELVDQYV